jgi:hypothetical protein
VAVTAVTAEPAAPVQETAAPVQETAALAALEVQAEPAVTMPPVDMAEMAAAAALVEPMVTADWERTAASEVPAVSVVVTAGRVAMAAPAALVALSVVALTGSVHRVATAEPAEPAEPALRHRSQ